MDAEFKDTLTAFLAQAKAHMEKQDTTIAQYEQFFSRAQELFPAYAEFVQHVNESLSDISENFHHSASEPVDHSVTAPAPAAKKQKAPSLKVDHAQVKQVLIVDDAEINRVLMSHFFKSLPVKLEFATSGEQAIAKVKDQSFDLILMDLQMKGMSGVEATKVIRESNSKTQIIAISNLEATDEERAQAMSAGANDYLNKSLTRDALRERVCEILFSASSLSA